MSSEAFAALIERRLTPYREAKVGLRVGVRLRLRLRVRIRVRVRVRVRVNPGPYA